MQTSMGHVASFAEQMLKGHKVVLTYGGQDLEKGRFDSVSNQMRQQSMKLVTAQAAASDNSNDSVYCSCDSVGPS